jgi:hypothetical protein
MSCVKELAGPVVGSWRAGLLRQDRSNARRRCSAFRQDEIRPVREQLAVAVVVRADRMNGVRKYVISTTREDLAWHKSQPVTG